MKQARHETIAARRDFVLSKMGKKVRESKEEEAEKRREKLQSLRKKFELKRKKSDETVEKLKEFRRQQERRTACEDFAEKTLKTWVAAVKGLARKIGCAEQLLGLDDEDAQDEYWRSLGGKLFSTAFFRIAFRWLADEVPAFPDYGQREREHGAGGISKTAKRFPAVYAGDQGISSWLRSDGAWFAREDISAMRIEVLEQVIRAENSLQSL